MLKAFLKAIGFQFNLKPSLCCDLELIILSAVASNDSPENRYQRSKEHHVEGCLSWFYWLDGEIAHKSKQFGSINALFTTINFKLTTLKDWITKSILDNKCD